MTTTTLGVFTKIENVDMLSANDGVAIASSTGPGENRYYLVETNDAGIGWTTVAPLPLSTFLGLQPPVPTLDFVSRDLGYVQGYQGSIFVTDDGGLTWSKVETAGIWPNFAITGSVLTVTSDVCTGAVPQYGPLNCPSELARYHLDATTPFSSHRVPKLGRTEFRAVDELTALTSRTDVVVEGGAEGNTSSLLGTNDAGATWTLLADPCEHLTIDQVLSPNPGTWLLNCFLDGGMNQGAHQLWQSTDQGVHWTIVAESNGEGNQVGDIGDMSTSLFLSGSRQILFGIVNGFGVVTSTDGGVRWVTTSVYGFDGATSTESTFGRTGAVVTVDDGPTYRTVNGTTWTTLPSLPIGTDPVSSMCTNQNDIGVKVAKTGAAMGTSYVTILFTNEGTPACWLRGIPEVQPVAGANGYPVGPTATRVHVAGRGGLTMLRVFGGEASITVGIETAANYPESSCRPKNANRLLIRFDQASYFVTIGVHQVCTSSASTNNAGVVKGVVGGP